MDSLKDILKKASIISGYDCVEAFEKGKTDRTENVLSTPIEESSPPVTTRLSRRTKKERQRIETAQRMSDRQRRSTLYDKKNKSKLAKLKARLKKAGVKNPEPKNIDQRFFERSAFITMDSSGWAGRFFARLCWHKVGIGLIHHAALQPGRNYSGSDPTALRSRRILATGLNLIDLSSPSARKKQGWNRVCKGIPQSALLNCLIDVNSRKIPHPNTLCSKHKKNDDENYFGGDISYLHALRRAGFCYNRQCKWKPGEDPSTKKGWHDIQPNEMMGALHPSGWYTSTVRYWIVSDQYTDTSDAERRAKLWLAWLAGTIPWQRDEIGAFVPCKDVPRSEVVPPFKPPD